MVLILLSTAPPPLSAGSSAYTPSSSSASPLSPRNHSSSPFFAVLSPLFDQGGPEDSTAIPPEAPSTQYKAPAFQIRHNSRPSARRVDKLLPPTPNSPAHRSPLQHAHRPRDLDIAAAERQRPRLAPTPAYTQSSNDLRSSSSRQSEAMSPTSYLSVSAHSPPPLSCGSSAPSLPGASTPSTPSTFSKRRDSQDTIIFDISIGMSPVDLAIPSTPRTPQSASAAHFQHRSAALGNSYAKSGPSSARPVPAPYPSTFSAPTSATSAAFDTSMSKSSEKSAEETDSMEVPLTIDMFSMPSPLRASAEKPAPRVRRVDELPPAPRLAPAPRRRQPRKVPVTAHCPPFGLDGFTTSTLPSVRC